MPKGPRAEGAKGPRAEGAKRRRGQAPKGPRAEGAKRRRGQAPTPKRRRPSADAQAPTPKRAPAHPRTRPLTHPRAKGNAHVVFFDAVTLGVSHNKTKHNIATQATRRYQRSRFAICLPRKLSGCKNRYALDVPSPTTRQRANASANAPTRARAKAPTRAPTREALKCALKRAATRARL